MMHQIYPSTQEQTVSKLTEVLKHYCVSIERQLWASRMEIRHVSQRSGDTMVITLAIWSIRDQKIVCSLIFGANHREVQRKALNKHGDLSMKDCITHFVSFEALNISVTVNNIQKKQYNNQRLTQQCYACDKSHNRCPEHTCETCCCWLPTPMTLAKWGSPLFPLVVHQPASPSIWPAVQSLRRGLSTNPGVTMWCVCGCS